MNNIKKIRKQKGLTITELANLIGMSQSNLTKIENNQIELKQDIINKIAQVLNVSSDAILNHTDENSYKVEILNPEVYNLPTLSCWNIPPTIPLKDKSQIKSYIQPDDTMQPTIPMHSLCLIDTSLTAITNGVFLIKQQNSISIKRLQTLDDTNLLVLTDNKSYQSSIYSQSDITVIGKVTSIITHQII